MALAKPNCFQLYCSEVTSQVYIIGSKGVPRKRTAFTLNRRWQVPVCLVLHHIRSTMFSAIIPTRPTVADSPKPDMKEFNFRLGCGYHQDRRQCSNASFLSQLPSKVQYSDFSAAVQHFCRRSPVPIGRFPGEREYRRTGLMETGSRQHSRQLIR